jgi:hypothetical protein
MIEIITENVKMPAVGKRRFQKDIARVGKRGQPLSINIERSKWTVTDTQEKKEIFRGSFEKAALICHNLNKKHYRQINSTKS